MKKDFILLKTILLYLLLSIFFTIYILGFKNIFPNNFNWLLSGDRLGELYGWLRFKNSDWEIPIGNYSQGDLGQNSVVFNGTIPLLAVIFKFLFKNIHDFQYFSFWFFLCFFLQGYISFKLIHRLSNQLLYSVIGSLFFVISPIFIHRLGIHISLAGHWIILLYFLNNQINNKHVHLYNIAILVLSVGIHFYFTAILFLADLIYYCWFFLRDKKFFLLKIFLLKILCLYIFMYLLGYFTFPSVNVLGGGFGVYKTNLLSFIDPGVETMGQKVIWSNILPDIRTNYGEHEGFNYFGLGFLLIFFISMFYFIKNLKKFYNKDFNVYLIIIIIFYIIALSNNIGFSNQNILSIQLNNWFLAPLSIIRASGRFIWIVNYFLLIFSLIIIFKSFPKNRNLIISIFLLIQFFDLHSGLKEYRNGNYFNNDIRVIKDNHWDKFEKNFNTLSASYLQNPSPEFYSMVGLLINSNLESELTLSARYDRKKFAEIRYKNYHSLFDSKLNDKVFIVSGLSHLNYLNYIYNKNKSIQFYKFNNNWLVYELANLNENIISNIEKIDLNNKKIELNKRYKINFEKTFQEVSFLGLGWTSYKYFETPWTDGNRSSLIFDISNLKNESRNIFLEINFENKFISEDEFIDLIVKHNGSNKEQNYKFLFEEPKSKKILIDIDRSLIEDDILIIDFYLSGNIKTDFENLIGIDQRKIGLMLSDLKFIN